MGVRGSALAIGTSIFHLTSRNCCSLPPTPSEFEGDERPDSFSPLVAAPAAPGAVQLLSTPPESYGAPGAAGRRCAGQAAVGWVGAAAPARRHSLAAPPAQRPRCLAPRLPPSRLWPAFHAEAAAQKHCYPLPKLVVLGMLAGAAEQHGVPGGRQPCWVARWCLAACSAAGRSRSPQYATALTSRLLPAGAYIGLGYSLCSLVGGQLSPELRSQEPGACRAPAPALGSRQPPGGTGSAAGPLGRPPAAPYLLRAVPPPAGVFNFLFGIFGFPMGLTLCVVAGAPPGPAAAMHRECAAARPNAAAGPPSSADACAALPLVPPQAPTCLPPTACTPR